MIAASMMETAAGEAGDPAFGSANPRMGITANRTTEQVLAFHSPSLERQLVRPPLSRYPQVAASLPPLVTVGGNPSATAPVLGHEVCKFVKKGAMNLLLGDHLKGWIQPDFPAPGNSHPRSGPHSGIPTDDEAVAKFRDQGKDEPSGGFLKNGIAPPVIRPGLPAR